MNQESKKRGLIIAIGGGENKKKEPVVLQKFVDLCNEGNGEIAIVPTASLLADTGPIYRRLFKRLGANRVRILDIGRRSDSRSSRYLAALDSADGVFMTGGDQLRLATMIGATEFSDKVLKRNAEGMHVAGTSAGAAFISEHMIANGKSGITPYTEMVNLATGIGLAKSLVIDQHFRQRHRIGRLVTALAFSPNLIGVGVDEDTAIFIDHEEQFKVVGSGWVTILDASSIEVLAEDAVRSRQPLSITDMRMHMLTAGHSYNIRTRKVITKQ